MENNNRYSKYLAIIALVLSVIGVSLGFAAYTNTVTIKARADVAGSGSSEWHGAQPSSDPNTPTQGTVTPKKCDSSFTTCTNASSTVASTANVTAQGIEGIDVHFTEPDQYYVYTFYAVNSSPYTSFLNSIDGIDENGTFNVTCTPAAVGSSQAASAEVTTDVCPHIHIAVVPGVGTPDENEYIEDDNDINYHEVISNSSERIDVRISYDAGYPADGGIEVAFGDITLTYDSAD